VPQTMESTFDALSSHVGIRRAVGRFFDRTARDRLLTNYFAGERADEMRQHLIALLSAAVADQPRSAHSTVRELTRVHRDLNITDTAFDRVLGHLNAAFVEAGTDDGTSRRVLIALSGMRTDIVSG
jgi:hemoglobin